MSHRKDDFTSRHFNHPLDTRSSDLKDTDLRVFRPKIVLRSESRLDKLKKPRKNVQRIKTTGYFL